MRCTQSTDSLRVFSGVVLVLVFGMFFGYTWHNVRVAEAKSVGQEQVSQNDQQTALIHEGKRIFDETPKYAKAYVGAKLSCADCHIQSGTADFAAPMINLAGLFPMYNKRAGRVITLQNRIQECFTRSENGQPPPIESHEMQALVAYINWLSKDGEKGKPYAGRGFVKLPALTGDPVRGKAIYASQCAICHGIEGVGVPPILPPVWGPDSYNDGAGMDNPAKMAAFVIHNMPQNHTGTLSPQEAYDVSVYIHTMPRPKFNEAYKNY
ncbi:MAG: c-type cytochrome [Acidobacteriaceae bacterium]